MNTLPFELRQVHAGWFVFRLGDAEVWGSNWLCHDGAGQLLRLLADVFCGERELGYAAFSGEPGSYVLMLRGGTRAELALWHTGQKLFDWYPSSVGADCVLTELPRHLRLEEQLLRVEDLDLYGLVRDAADAFAGVDRKEYERDWMPFPDRVLLELRLALGDSCPNPLTERKICRIVRF